MAAIWLFGLILLASCSAGFVGSLAGLGGGIIIVPILTLVFHLPFELAVGASIVSVIATSSGAAAAYLRDHLTNLHIGMFLEIATTAGALCGALAAAWLPTGGLFVIFGIVLLISALPTLWHHDQVGQHAPAPCIFARRLALDGQYIEQGSGNMVAYTVHRVPQGFGLMYIAGLISGLLGIGSGTFTVLAMDSVMGLPFKVSTTTSNFMIGVTAAASAGIYLMRGAIQPTVAAPVALGVLLGATLGARVLPRVSSQNLRRIFVVLMLFIAGEMLVRGIAALW